MPTDPYLAILVSTVEIAGWLGGSILLWRLLTGRMGPSTPVLKPWPISLEGFVTGIMLIAAGGFLLPQATSYLSNDILGPAAYDGEWWLVVQGAAFQLGLLGGALLSGIYLRFQIKRLPKFAPVVDEPTSTVAPTLHPLLAGTVTFLIAIPLIGAISFVSKVLVEWLGFAVDEQEMIGMFRNFDEPVRLIFMTVLAAVVAPVTEELVFRAGFFRYLRTRTTRGFALVLPAFIFAWLHGNVAAFLPLFALGVFFAMAYERTGRIFVPIIAHALFNLHTILLVLSGVTS
ncbi:MAG: CPBP family intramembrane glutamic endopeptidase [Opitutaceae bacterium]